MLETWIKVGFDHIWDMDGYDHLLYLATLCALFSLKDWKKVIWIATAFTIGHTISLVFNAYDMISVSPSLIEKLIPITIIITALYNLFAMQQAQRNMKLEYIVATAFGLIHGMGVSNYLKSMLIPDDSFIWALLGFNIGVELGQILIVMITLVIGYLLMQKFKLERKYWVYGISIVSILLCIKILFF